MKYIISNIKNIKTSLCQILNYILNKKIEKDKFNNFEDLEDAGKEAWNFISAIYNTRWDTFITDSNSVFFKNQVTTKFMLNIILPNILKNNNIKNVDKPASINKLLPLIPAKMPKEINNITKYFRKSNQLKGKIKLYAQAINLSINNTRKVLKIKEMFSNLQANKIENI